MDCILTLKMSSTDDSDDADEIGAFIIEVMNMELAKWGITFELIECKQIK